MGKYGDNESYFFGEIGLTYVHNNATVEFGDVFTGEVNVQECINIGAYISPEHPNPEAYYVVQRINAQYSIGAFVNTLVFIEYCLLKNNQKVGDSYSVDLVTNDKYSYSYIFANDEGKLCFGIGMRNTFDVNDRYYFNQCEENQGHLSPIQYFPLVDGQKTFTFSEDAEKKIDPSQTGGGGGTMSVTSVPVGFPGLPTLSAVNTGFITLYNPTLAEMQRLGDYLWDIESEKNFASDSKNVAEVIKEKVGSITNTFEVAQLNPIQYLSSLTIFPFQPSATTRNPVKFGYVSSDIICNRVTNQFQTIDCGSIKLDEFWGNALDYNPWTSVELYLPFCGTHRLDVDDVMDSTINVAYMIDLLTGMCTALVRVVRENLDSVLYHYSGVCGANVPISQQTHAEFIKSCMGAIGNVGQIIGGAVSGNVGAGVSGAMGLVSNALGSKQTISHGSSTSMVSGMMDNLKPILIVNRPIQSLAKNYNHYVGYPSNITSKLSSLSGFTQVEKVVTNNVKATEEEKREIERLLKEGVWL